MAVTEKPIGQKTRRMLEEVLASQRYRAVLGGIRRYRCPMPFDELVSEFHLGLIVGAEKAKPNIGDPKEFVLYRGMCQVKMAVAKACNHAYIEECLNCGKHRPWRKNACARCGHRNFLLHDRVVEFEEADAVLNREERGGWR